MEIQRQYTHLKFKQCLLKENNGKKKYIPNAKEKYMCSKHKEIL